MLKPTDRIAVSGEIQTANEKIARLEAKKSALLGQIEKLDFEITELQGQRDKLTSRIAAIWVLPNEILSYIFEHGASIEEEENKIDDDDNSEDGPEKPDFQILVSHVSRHFREVAINTPSLWSEIHVLDLKEPRLDYIRTCLRRSGSLPFSISLDCGEHEDFPRRPDPAIDEAMILVQDNIFRLERFSARFPFFHLLHQTMTFLRQPAPILATLELCEVDYELSFDEDISFGPNELRAPLTLFEGNAPNLIRVQLDGVHVAWSQCNFRNLAALCLGYHTKDVRPTYHEFQTIIQNSPSLGELSLQGSGPLLSENISESSLYKPFSLEALEELRISDISSDYASTLISLFHAPNLKSLILSELDTNDYSALFDRIAGPPLLFPNLISLKLVSIQADDAAAARLLRAYPKLEWLGLYAPNGCPQWVALLEHSEEGDDTNTPTPESARTNAHLCPALKCLRCIDIELNDIKEVIIKRKEANLPIPKLELDKREERSPFRDKTTLAWLKENARVEFVEPSDYGSDDDDDLSGDDSAWVSEDGDSFPYFEFSDELDYDDGLGYDDEDEDEDEDEDVDEDDDEESEGESGMDISDVD